MISPALRRLIVTADDFGADESVNAAIEQAHRQGILTATSLMVGAPAAADAVRRARSMPSLGVGLHLVLVEGTPVSAPQAVSRLVDDRGRFRTDMAAAGARIFFDPRARAQLASEIEAQFAAFAATGLPLDHVNAHKHFHLHPTIGDLICRIGARYGLAAARAPVEPAAVLDRIEPGARSPLDRLVETFARLAGARLARAGLMLPDRVFGLRWSGAMTAARVRGLIEALPEGLTEIYLHPGLHGAFEGAAPGYRYAEELAALVDPQVRAAVEKVGAHLGRFADFAPSRGAAAA